MSERAELPRDVKAPSSLMRAIGINPEKDFDLTYDQISTMSGLSSRTIRALVAEGKLGCIRHNSKNVRIPLEEWRRYREAHRVAGSAAIRRNFPHQEIDDDNRVA